MRDSRGEHSERLALVVNWEAGASGLQNTVLELRHRLEQLDDNAYLEHILLPTNRELRN